MRRTRPAPVDRKRDKPGCLRLVAGFFALTLLAIVLFSACSAMFASDPGTEPPASEQATEDPVPSPEPDPAPSDGPADHTAVFYASPLGEKWAEDAVTVKRIDSALTVWVVTGNLDSVEEALQLCQDVQATLAEPDHQINVGVLGDRTYVSTMGDPETCTVE